MALTSGGYDGDIKLAVDLDAGDVKKASKELQQGIKEVFDATAGKRMDKTLKSIESSMSKASEKANELHSKLEKIESTKIPTEEYSKLAKEVEASEKSVTKLSEKLELASEKVQSSDIAKKFTEAEDLYEKYQGLYESLRKTQGETDHATVAAKVEADKAKATLESLRGKYEQLLEPLNKMASELERSEDKLKESKKALDEMVASGKAFTLGEDSAEYEKTADQLANVNNQMRVLLEQANKYTVDGDEVVKTTDKSSTSLKKFGSTCLDVANKLEGIVVKLAKLAGHAFISGITRLKNAFAGLSKSSDASSMSMSKMFRNLLRYGLGIRSVYALVNKIRSAIKEGIDSMAQFNGGVNAVNNSMTTLTSALAYLKNSWASAFAPILNYVTPVLVSLINTISAVVNKIAQLMAALTGATSYMRAKSVTKDYAGSLSGGGGSKGKSAQEKYEEAKKKAQERYDKQVASVEEKRAKAAAKAEEQQAKAAAKLAKEQEKANKALGHYDKLNVIAIEEMEDFDDNFDIPEYEDPILEEVNWDDFADAGAGALEEMFEEVPIDPWIQELADKIKAIIDQILEPLKKAWDEMKDYLMEGWKYMTKQIGELFKSIGRDFLKVWQQAETIEIFKNLLGIVGDIEFVIGNIARNLNEAWNYNDTGLHILENIRDIFGIIVQHVRNVTTYMKEWSDTLDFKPLLTSIEKLTDSLKLVADFLGGVFEDIMKNVVLKYIKWLIETGLPKLNDKLTEFNQAVHWDELREKLNKVWEAAERLMEKLTEGLIDAIGNLSQAVADFVNSDKFDAFLNNLVNFMDSIQSEDVEKVLTGIGTGILKIVEALVDFVNSDMFQGFIKALGDWFNNTDADGIGTALKNIALAILGFEFAKFVGGGLMNFLTFLTTLQAVAGAGGGAAGAGGLAGIASGLGAVATGLGLIAGAAADAVVAMEFFNLKGLNKLKDDLPTTADSTNGLTKEMNFLEEGFKKVWEATHPGETLADYIVVPDDLTKLENMRDQLDNLDANLETLGLTGDGTREKINEMYQMWYDNGETMAGMTDEQVQKWVELYTSVQDYYNEAIKTDEVKEKMEGLVDVYGVLVEKAPNGEQGREAGVEFGSGIVDGTTEQLSDTSKLEEAGGFLVQGVRQGVQMQLTSDEIASWWEPIKDTFVSLFQIGSPSVVFEELGTFLIEGLQLGIEESWASLMEFLTVTLTELKDFFMDMWSEIRDDVIEAWENIKQAVAEKFESVRSTIYTIAQAIKNVIRNMVTTVCDLFKQMHSTIQSVVSGIQSTISSLVSSITSAVSSVSSAISGIASAAGGVMSSIGGAVSNISSNIRIPHLAQGAVIPPRSEFLAVLGDQQRGTNIETPLETMIQAFESALDAHEDITSSKEPIVLQLDGRTIAEVVWDEENKRYKQRGGDWQPAFA